MRVEERLAADPTARQLLEQLRSVSHAVKKLPQTPLGADIRDAVLRRAEREMLVTSPKDRTVNDSVRDISPRFTFGRSVRGWVWAGLATAAGLAIMAFNSSSHRNADMPATVAERRNEAVDQAKPNSDVIVKSARPEAPREPPAMAATPPTDQVASGGLAANQPMSRVEQERIAKRQLSPDANDANLLVVHVQLKPEAYKQRAFDEVLKRNGIAVEDSSDEAKSSPLAANRSAKDAVTRPSATAPAPLSGPETVGALRSGGSQSLPLSDLSTAASDNTDLLFVEAAPAQIQSCLEELHRDQSDYLAVAVDEDQAAANKAKRENAPEENWVQYNRGYMPQQQSLQRSEGNQFYYQTEHGRIAIDRGDNRSAEAQQTKQLSSNEKNVDHLSESRGQGDADEVAIGERSDSEVRPQCPGGRTRYQRDVAVECRHIPAIRRPQHQETPELKAAAQPSETLQVLFVLSPGDQPAISPPTETKAAK